MSRLKAGAKRRASCRLCERHRDDGAQISRNGICQDCAMRRQIESIQAVQAGEGPMYERWVAGMRRRSYHPMRDPDADATPDG